MLLSPHLSGTAFDGLQCGVEDARMRSITHMLHPSDVGDLEREIQRLFQDLARSDTSRPARAAGQCFPVLDMFETETTLEVVLDVPGVVADQLRILVKGALVLVVGEKQRPDPPANGTFSFHLVERDFGRFARAVRLNAAFDVGRVRARLRGGELRIVLPKIQDRRGREFLIPIETEATPRAEGP